MTVPQGEIVSLPFSIESRCQFPPKVRVHQNGWSPFLLVKIKNQWSQFFEIAAGSQ